jgi:hypothetical protein
VKATASIVLAFALMITAVAAYSEDKRPDTKNAILTPVRVPIVGELTEASPQYGRTLPGGPDLMCNANPGISDAGTAVYYAVHCFEVTDETPIQLILNDGGSSIEDTFLTLYCEPFDPLLPSDGVIIADDDDGDGLLSAVTLDDNVHLVPGSQYLIVISTFGNGTTGTYRIDASYNVAECGATPVSSATWGQLKSIYR